MSVLKRNKSCVHLVITIKNDLLLWIVCRMREYLREEAANDPIDTLHNDAIFVCMLELRIIEENCLCGLKQFTAAVSKQGSRGCLIERPLNDFLNFIWHLKSNYMMYLLE